MPRSRFPTPSSRRREKSFSRMYRILHLSKYLARTKVLALNSAPTSASATSTCKLPPRRLPSSPTSPTPLRRSFRSRNRLNAASFPCFSTPNRISQKATSRYPSSPASAPVPLQSVRSLNCPRGARCPRELPRFSRPQSSRSKSQIKNEK